MSGVVMIDVLFRFVWFPRKEYIDHNGVQLCILNIFFIFMNLCFPPEIFVRCFMHCLLKIQE